MTTETTASCLSVNVQNEETSCSLFGKRKISDSGGGGHSDINGGGDGSSSVSRNNASSNPNAVGTDDADLARELNALSVHEREEIFDDIHGVFKTPEEPPEFVASRLEQLDKELAELPRNRRRKAWDRARFLKPSIETDTEFKLMFLRADQYDAEKAARRIAKYFDDKMKLFGEDKLAKKLTLDDLSEEDRNVFRSGFYMVILPHKDSSGRPIWFCDLTKYNFNYSDSLVRCTWYQVMTTLEDNASQLKGVANVAYWPGSLVRAASSLAKISKTTKKIGDMIVGLPCRVTSYHFCYNDHAMNFVLSTVRKTFGKQIRLRVRTHFGSDVEMQYSLLTFGIECPPYLFDHDNPHGARGGGGQEKKNLLLEEYLQQRLVRDRLESQLEREKALKSGFFPYPYPMDVLVGRGSPFQNFSGNLALSNLIDSRYMSQYTKLSDRFEKTCLFMDVVKTIQETFGGRFLERTSKGWTVVDDQTAREKVSSSFRSKKESAKQQYYLPAPTTTSSSTTTTTNAEQPQQWKQSVHYPSTYKAGGDFDTTKLQLVDEDNKDKKETSCIVLQPQHENISKDPPDSNNNNNRATKRARRVDMTSGDNNSSSSSNYFPPCSM